MLRNTVRPTQLDLSFTYPPPPREAGQSASLIIDNNDNIEAKQRNKALSSHANATQTQLQTLSLRPYYVVPNARRFNAKPTQVASVSRDTNQCTPRAASRLPGALCAGKRRVGRAGGLVTQGACLLAGQDVAAFWDLTRLTPLSLTPDSMCSRGTTAEAWPTWPAL